MVLQDILRENAEYYLQRKKELVGALLLIPAGSLCRRKIRGGQYWYLRQYAGGNRRRDIYLGRSNDSLAEAVREAQKRRPKLLQDLVKAKRALRMLGFKEVQVNRENLDPVLKELITAFDLEGLWEVGLELVGSWCFKVYQNYLGVEFYPFRTQDIDLAVKLPYRGEKKDIAGILQSLGYQPRFNAADGTISYVGEGITVEFIRNRQGSGNRSQHPQVPELGLAPVPVPYLNLLLDNPYTLKLHKAGKVVVPHPAAFFLHKLLIAPARKDPAKREKDLRQAAAVAKTVALDEAMLEKARDIADGMPKAWKKKLRKAADQARMELGQAGEPAAGLWRVLEGA